MVDAVTVGWRIVQGQDRLSSSLNRRGRTWCTSTSRAPRSTGYWGTVERVARGCHERGAFDLVAHEFGQQFAAGGADRAAEHDEFRVEDCKHRNDSDRDPLAPPPRRRRCAGRMLGQRVETLPGRYRRSRRAARAMADDGRAADQILQFAGVRVDVHRAPAAPGGSRFRLRRLQHRGAPSPARSTARPRPSPIQSRAKLAVPRAGALGAFGDRGEVDVVVDVHVDAQSGFEVRADALARPPGKVSDEVQFVGAGVDRSLDADRDHDVPGRCSTEAASHAASIASRMSDATARPRLVRRIDCGLDDGSLGAAGVDDGRADQRSHRRRWRRPAPGRSARRSWQRSGRARRRHRRPLRSGPRAPAGPRSGMRWAWIARTVRRYGCGSARRAPGAGTGRCVRSFTQPGRRPGDGLRRHRGFLSFGGVTNVSGKFPISKAAVPETYCSERHDLNWLAIGTGEDGS